MPVREGVDKHVFFLDWIRPKKPMASLKQWTKTRKERPSAATAMRTATGLACLWILYNVKETSAGREPGLFVLYVHKKI